MARKSKNPIPVVETVVTDDPNSIGVYINEYEVAQQGFDATAGYKTYFSSSGFTSRDSLSRITNQGIARMTAACLGLMAERACGLRPDGTRYDNSCEQEEAKALFAAFKKAMPSILKDGAYRAQLAQTEAAAADAKVKLATFCKNNGIDLPESPFDLNTLYSFEEVEVEAEAEVEVEVEATA